MATITTRSGKGSALTHTELDNNFTNLNTDKVEASGDTITGNLDFNDNVKARFGAGQDLEIYHSGSDSFINDAGTGSLKLQTGGSSKLTITSTGVSVSGTLVADGLTVDSNNALKLDSNFPTGSRNVALGDEALKNAGSSSQDNVGIGNDALKSMTTGVFNTAVGGYAGGSQTTANNSAAFGYNALASVTTGSENTAVGSQAGTAITTGLANVAVGHKALKTVTTGSSNTALGWKALESATTSSYNVAIGRAAGNALTTGTQNVAIGGFAFDVATTGSNNVALGYAALSASTTASNNTALGALTLDALTTGNDNTAVGAQALSAVTTGGNNVGVGKNAALALTTGTQNTVVGSNAGYLLATTTANTVLGYNALSKNVSANRNTAIGVEALKELATTGSSYNVAVGYYAGRVITTGDDNTIVGSLAGDAMTTGATNSMLGYAAGSALTTGSNNTFVGKNSGGNITTGSQNVILGSYNGNQGSLDLRTTSNHIVLSDGSGNPRIVVDGSGNAGVGAVNPNGKFESKTTGAGSLTYNDYTAIGVNISGETQTTQGSLGSGLAFSNGGAKRGQISLVKTGTDNDVTGLGVYTHPSATFSGALELAMMIGYGTGNLVGIGRSAPASILEVADSNAELRITDTRDATFSLGDRVASLAFCSDDTSGSSGGANTLPRAAIDVIAASTFGSAHDMVFKTRADEAAAASEKLRIRSDGRLIAPYGITLGTSVGTYAAANTLDDYEEGTFTPTYAPETGSFTTMSMDVVSAIYTKVGNIVTISIFMRTDDVDVTGASGDVVVTGLPFLPTGYSPISIGSSGTWAASGSYPQGGYIFNSGGTGTIVLKTQSTANGPLGTDITVSDLRDGTVNNANTVTINATYFTTA